MKEQFLLGQSLQKQAKWISVEAYVLLLSSLIYLFADDYLSVLLMNISKK